MCWQFNDQRSKSSGRNSPEFQGSAGLELHPAGKAMNEQVESWARGQEECEQRHWAGKPKARHEGCKCAWDKEF